MSSVYSERLPALSDKQAPELVLLHGWGVGSDIWRPCLPYLRRHYRVTLVDLPGFGRSEYVAYDHTRALLVHLLNHLPDNAIYLGFSMGGMLAVQAAHYFPHRVRAVVTMASNVRFVANAHWPQAMMPNDFYAFCQSAIKHPNKTLNRFLALQAKGCVLANTLLKSLRGWLGLLSGNGNVLGDSLNWLASIDNSVYLRDINVPWLAVFGEFDALVPVAAARRLYDMLAETTKGQVAIIKGASHLPFLSHPTQCWQMLGHFLSVESLLAQGLQSEGLLAECLSPTMVVKRSLDKFQVARSFSRAAKHYNNAAHVQRYVGEKLMAKLPKKKLPKKGAHTIVDLGCGTGLFIKRLQDVYGSSDVVGLDIAEGMLAVARLSTAKHVVDKNHCLPHWLCGDAENVPLASTSVDLIFANLTIQWCQDSDALFAEAYRIVKPGGYFVYSTLGPRTLHELRRAWSIVDNYVHVNPFIERDVLVRSIDRSRFQRQHISQEIVTREYHKLNHLTRELKELGVHNLNQGRFTGLMGKQRIKCFRKAYNAQRTARGLLPATYEVWYGVLRK